MLWLSAGLAAAHEVQPSVADVEISGDALTLTIRTAVEPLIAGVDLSAVADTDDSPLAQENDALRALPPDALEERLRAAWPAIAQGLTVAAGDAAVAPELADVEIPAVGDVEVRRDSVLTIAAPLPEGDDPVTIAWASELGGLIVRQGDAEAGYETYLTSGAVTDPLPRAGVAEASLGDVIVRYLVSGFDHIVPQGLDHILFVLGLFLYALAWRPLLWQVTAFTAAHTVTLAMATTGVVNIPDDAMWIVESIIALSIVYVAVENVLVARRGHVATVTGAAAGGGTVAYDAPGGPPTVSWARVAVVFGFGLLHGLGFASVLSEFGLGEHLAASLIAFNVGVEAGQLFVIAVAFLVLLVAFRAIGRPLRPEGEGFRAIAAVGSLLIGAVGAWWVIERTLLG